MRWRKLDSEDLVLGGCVALFALFVMFWVVVVPVALLIHFGVL